ncbi:uncharacterized protein LOC130736451 [Lotus japonicus]|uniref:uncharacterized protein LOC130736451 n=1 Tax=Lotus japonicus TaxID=34305 RepID=UPI0025863D6C|nr:uncharacterized protein LOC130736451 [Lotus japonicus]
MGGAKRAGPKERIDLVKEGKMKVDFVNGNTRQPCITVHRSVIEEMCAPWKEALIVCLLGKQLGFRTMKSRLAITWRLGGDFELLDVGNGFFMVKFDSEEDKNKVMGGGPWMIFDHYLAVSTWNADFIAPEARVTRTLAWIRIPGLNVVFYDENFLLSVAQVIGTPVKVDVKTLRGDRGRFARICVELDLTKPVIGRIMVEGYWYNIQYEGLHVICTKCGCYGHRSCECQYQPPEDETPQPQGGKSTTGQEPAAPPSEKQGTETRAAPIAAVTAGAESDASEIHEAVEKDQMEITKEEVITESGTANSKLEDPNVEAFGDWMVVTRKKKKPFQKSGAKTEVGKQKRQQNQGGGTSFSNRNVAAHGDPRGKAKSTKPNHGIVIANQEGPKLKEEKTKPLPFSPKSMEFNMGPAATIALETKKKRARVEDLVFKDPLVGPVNNHTTPTSKAVVSFAFQASQNNDTVAEDYMQRFSEVPTVIHDLEQACSSKHVPEKSCQV